MRRESASYGSAMRRPLALGALWSCRLPEGAELAYFTLTSYAGSTPEADRGFWRLVGA